MNTAEKILSFPRKSHLASRLIHYPVPTTVPQLIQRSGQRHPSWRQLSDSGITVQLTWRSAHHGAPRMYHTALLRGQEKGGGL